MSACSGRGAIRFFVALTSLLTTSRASGGERLSEATDACIAASERGQALAIGRKFLAARTELVSCARESCPAPIVKDCVAQLAKVNESLASVVFVATDPDGSALSVVRVTMDGSVLAEKLDGMAVDVDPGVHHVRFEAPDRPPVERDVLVEQGAKLKVVSVTLTRPTRAIVAPPPPRETPSSGPPIAAFVAAGVSLVGFVGFAGFGIAGLDQSSDLHSLKPTQYTSADVTSLRTKLAIADVCLGVGIVAAGFATWLFLSDSRSTPSARTGFDLHYTPGGALGGWQMVY